MAGTRPQTTARPRSPSSKAFDAAPRAPRSTTSARSQSVVLTMPQDGRHRSAQLAANGILACPLPALRRRQRRGRRYPHPRLCSARGRGWRDARSRTDVRRFQRRRYRLRRAKDRITVFAIGSTPLPGDNLRSSTCGRRPSAREKQQNAIAASARRSRPSRSARRTCRWCPRAWCASGSTDPRLERVLWHWRRLQTDGFEAI